MNLTQSLLASISRVFSFSIFTKSYWVGDFPHEPICFDCKRLNCSETDCKNREEEYKKMLIEEGMIPQD